ncbi:MerR family transcriptional regulator [Niveibacterium terrae]|uniref:MerR family transcriptional regulator n=1 Tax=Niveibacterium terrae TaxID=3373598 RepID=UPI003A925EC8
MKIGQAARESGVTIRMLRYYEDQGLIHPRRSDARYREYAQADVELARRVQALSRAGLTLAVIAAILPCVASLRADAAKPCPNLLSVLRRKQQELEEQIALFELQRAAIADYLLAQSEDGAALSKSSAADFR